MKSSLGWIVLTGVVAATVLLLTMSARAGERGQDAEVLEASTPEPEADVPPAEADDGTLLSVEETPGGDEPAPPAMSPQQVHDSLAELSAGGGLRLPPPLAVDTSDWQLVEAGPATMRVPADWIVHNRIGEPGDDDRTVGLSPPSNDLYVELRAILKADNNYRQLLAEHARSEYSRSPERLAEGVILGFQPRLQGGAAGHVEVMNQFGKEFDDDGARTFRLILWRGRWEQAGEFHRAELTATFAQDRHDEVAPLVAAILDTVAIRVDTIAEP